MIPDRWMATLIVFAVLLFLVLVIAGCATDLPLSPPIGAP